jgi:N-acetylmuramoyl-L-alanine amidase
LLYLGRMRGLISTFLYSFCITAGATSVVVIDSGHTPSTPGAIGSCGKREVDYNDETVKVLQAKVLASGDYSVVLTRENQREVLSDITLAPSKVGARESPKSLLKRSTIANDAGAQFFISIHHDSIDDSKAKGFVTSDKTICDGKGGNRMTDAFKAAHLHRIGFNVFFTVADDNPKRTAASKALAEIIGKRLIAEGMDPSDFHVKPFENCFSCRTVDAANGVVSKDLSVLRNSKMPGILIETENIADPEFEKIANAPGFNDKIADAVKGGLDEYCSQHPADCNESAPAGTLTGLGNGLGAH